MTALYVSECNHVVINDYRACYKYEIFCEYCVNYSKYSHKYNKLKVLSFTYLSDILYIQQFKKAYKNALLCPKIRQVLFYKYDDARLTCIRLLIKLLFKHKYVTIYCIGHAIPKRFIVIKSKIIFIL